jgi:DNA-binding MarR family transcriptional regulator
MPMTKDHVDDLLEPLQAELPGIDFAPWELTLRIQRLANYLHLDESAYEPFGINRAGVDILVQLRQNAPQYRVSPTQLCVALQSKSATMTSRLDKLEQAGLVRRLPDPADRRALLVELTTDGRALVERVMASLVQMRADQLHSLTATERRQLIDTLRKLSLVLERRI